MSGYKDALEAAGAKVFAFHEFGSYQGEWVALVVYDNEAGWVSGAYGSCGGCDAFIAELGDLADPWCDEHSYAAQDDCPECQKAHKGYTEKLVDFGRSYLDDIRTTDEILEPFRQQASWDDDAEEAIRTIEATGGDFMVHVALALSQGDKHE